MWSSSGKSSELSELAQTKLGPGSILQQSSSTTPAAMTKENGPVAVTVLPHGPCGQVSPRAVWELDAQLKPPVAVDVVVAAVGDFGVRVSQAAETADIGGEVKDATSCGDPVPVADDIDCDVIKAVSCKDVHVLGSNIAPGARVGAAAKIGREIEATTTCRNRAGCAVASAAGVEGEVEKIKGPQCLRLHLCSCRSRWHR